jgi:hypothetical protein
MARDAHREIGWSHKRGAALVAAGEKKPPRKNIGSVLAPKEVEVPFEDRPLAETGPERAIIEQEGPARGPVCADDALVAFNRQQHGANPTLRQCYRHDPV